MSKKKQETLFWGVVLLIIGVLFMMDNFGIDIDIWEIIGDYWPLILIGIGLKNIWAHIQTKNNPTEK